MSRDGDQCHEPVCPHSLRHYCLQSASACRQGRLCEDVLPGPFYQYRTCVLGVVPEALTLNNNYYNFCEGVSNLFLDPCFTIEGAMNYVILQLQAKLWHYCSCNSNFFSNNNNNNNNINNEALTLNNNYYNFCEAVSNLFLDPCFTIDDAMNDVILQLQAKLWYYCSCNRNFVQ